MGARQWTSVAAGGARGGPLGWRDAGDRCLRPLAAPSRGLHSGGSPAEGSCDGEAHGCPKAPKRFACHTPELPEGDGLVKQTVTVRSHDVSPGIARVIFEKGMSHCSPTARFYALERSIRCCRSLALPSRPCPSCGHPARLRRRAIPGPRGLLTVWSPLSPPTGRPSLRP